MSGPRLIVLGRTGQLAASLVERAPEHDLVASIVSRPEFDLADPDGLKARVMSTGADIIVNAAAYTAVDQAEDEPERAETINASAPAALAEAAAAMGARLIHVSTDYVFDGSGTQPWREIDPPRPTSVYGATKLAGEEAIRSRLADHAIVRTAWVYSPFGKNFVRTMLSLAETRSELRVVSDQVGNPTSAFDLADGILRIVRAWQEDPQRGIGATYHLAGSGSTSWAHFAEEIFAQSRLRGGPSASVIPIATAEWPARAARPLNSRLDTSRFEETFGYTPPPWQESLATVLERLLPPSSC